VAEPARQQSLVVVESPAKARTIERYLGPGFTVLASMGHVRDLPKKELGVDLEGGTFEPKYVSLRSKAKVVKALRTAAEASDTIFLATDPDREGEAIAWHVAELLGGKGTPAGERFRRLSFNEITRTAVTEALEATTDVDRRKVEAQKARRVLDRLVGYQISPILWKGLYRGLSAGRVQSVALRLICEREAEIEAFESEEYWTLEALFATTPADGSAEVVYSATLEKIDGTKAKIGSESEADTLLERARGESYAIAAIEKKARRRNPPPPFITSTLQQEAARKLGYSAKRTMSLAQQLYEGIDIPGEGPTGLITYMRTDSVRIADSALESARAYIEDEYGKAYLPAKPRRFRSAKGAQDAHEAIRPTGLNRPPARTRAYLNRDQLRLYELIWKRFLASQMNPAEIEQTAVLTTGGAFEFKSTGSVVVFPGYLAVYREGTDEGEDGEGERNGSVERGKGSGGDRELPPGLEQGAGAELRELEGEQHFTRPPARFTEASLVKELEADGIGRPSTYAQIISVLLDRRYVERERASLLPTDLGRIVNDLLSELFPDIIQVEFTAGMEAELDRIESGEDDFLAVMRDFYEPFAEDLTKAPERVGEIMEQIRAALMKRCEIEEIPDCPAEGCDGMMYLRFGRNGWFWTCRNWPKCKGTAPFECADGSGGEGEGHGEEPEVDVVCPECGAAMVVKRGRFGRFLACSRYPDCKGSLPLLIGVDCPECGQPLAEKRTRKGKTFWGCSGYPECDFATWNKPVARACPTCGHPFLEEKTTKKEGHHLACPKCRSIYDPDRLEE